MPQLTADLPIKILSTIKDIESDILLGIIGLYERRLEVESCVPIYIGIENPTKLLQLSVVIPRAFYHLVSLEDTEGFSVRVIADKNTSHFFKVCVHLLNKEFYELFLVLIQDLIEAILKSVEIKSAIEQFIERIENWKRFLKKSTHKVLTFEEQLGLAGELQVLSYLININGQLSALNSWTGPLGSAQDFHRKDTFIEVKSSSAKHEKEIKISSEYQLDVPAHQKLYLCHCIFNINEDLIVNYTLPHLVAEIAKDMSEPHKIKFYGLLKAVGYFFEDAELYRLNMFKPVKNNYYEITDSFPKLASRDLPKSIFNVHYTIATDLIYSFLIDPTTTTIRAN